LPVPDAKETFRIATQKVRQDTGAKQRLEVRRQRKDRNRRISAAVLSIVIVLLVAAALVQSYDNGPTPGTSPTPIRTSSYRLAYDRAGQFYVANANAAQPVRIITGADPGRDPCGDGYGGPVWSPDGRYLAFRCGVTSVTIADPTGRVVSSFRVGMGWHVSWSPDSTSVAVWARRSDVLGHHRTIGIYAIDGTLEKVLPVPLGFSGDYDPSWSPDGQSIFVQDVEIPVDGSPPRIAAPRDPQALCCPIAYSPDGTRVAYIGGDPSHPIVVSPTSGSGGELSLASDAQDPAWSPSGERIAFEVGRGQTYSSAEDVLPTAEIRTVDVATGTVTSVLTLGSGYVVHVIGFSPDGDRILFARTDAFSKRDGHSHPELWSVGTDGSDPQLLVAGANSGAWQP
jgi:Tol biopolymer transport system component